MLNELEFLQPLADNVNVETVAQRLELAKFLSDEVHKYWKPLIDPEVYKKRDGVSPQTLFATARANASRPFIERWLFP